ncbi:hypothetical protein GCM10009733_020420 [Nonomuraea maheshkhaliensis]|uniref:Uncharacterized protein n=1 Tax=Nonomuraea maheshkhaliensis TaxID=419590 RepID=A0ABP4QX14_9ACTN
MEVNDNVKAVEKRARALANDRVTAVVNLALLDEEIEKAQLQLADRLKAREELYTRISSLWSTPELRELGIKPDGPASRTTKRPRGRPRTGTSSSVKDGSAPPSDDSSSAQNDAGRGNSSSPDSRQPRATEGTWSAAPQT